MNIVSSRMDDFSLDDWLEYLEKLHPKKIDLGLERSRAVAERLDILHPAPYVITVAGTNGKGTTCRTLEMILLASGYRVGVYSSPHLVHYTERVRIQGQLLPSAEHIATFQKIERKRAEISLSYFEFATLSALCLFKQHKMDVVILEVGVGGRLDATNIIDSHISVITSIALDHIALLGNTREKIGFEKAGIMRKNCPVVVGESDCPHSIIDYAEHIQAVTHLCYPHPSSDWSFQLEDTAQTWSFQSTTQCFSGLPIPRVPLPNAATALACLAYSGLALSEEAIHLGLTHAQLAGRFQQIQNEPRILLDVAHNPHAAQYLAGKLAKLPKTGRLFAVVGILSDKEIKQILEPMEKLVDEWRIGTLYGVRGASASQVASYLPATANICCFDEIVEAFQDAIREANRSDTIIVFGSFHTVGEILERCTYVIEGETHVIKI